MRTIFLTLITLSALNVKGQGQTRTPANSAYSNKQETLVSGTNIKTVNSTSLLGSGNIVVSHAKAISIAAPTSTENVMIWFTDVAITVTNVQESLAGTSPSVTYILGYSSTRSGALTNIVNSHAATSTTGTAATLTANVAIPANSYIILTSSATSGTITDFNVTISYRQ